MENCRVLCHYINTITPENYVTKMLKEIKNQGWEFISIYSNSDHNKDGYINHQNSSKT